MTIANSLGSGCTNWFTILDSTTVPDNLIVRIQHHEQTIIADGQSVERSFWLATFPKFVVIFGTIIIVPVSYTHLTLPTKLEV